MYGASASTSLWKILCSSTSFSTISRSSPYPLLFTFACIRTHSDMNRFHLKPYIQKKDGEVCLDTHQFLINYLSPVDGGNLLWSCDVVNAIMLLLELHQTHSQLFHTFSLRRKKNESSTIPAKVTKKNIHSTEFCFHSIKHEMLLNISVQRWPCRQSYNVNTHSFSIISAWGCCKREAWAASSSRLFRSSSEFRILLLVSSWYRGCLPSLIFLIS